jgi:hypothetical protein
MMWHSYGDAVLRFLHGGAAHTDHGAAAIPPGAGHDLASALPAHSPYTKSRHFAPDLQALLRYDKIELPFGANEEIRRFTERPPRTS